ncbi:MAG: tetratricopeptide repeat protein [Methanolinea sp.]|nr:tetratricopeptide repeat protein [Methanolinea sp.]
MRSGHTAWGGGRIGIFLAAATVLVILAAPVLADTPAEIAQGLMRRADDLVLQGQYTEALDLYREAIELDPYSSQIWNRLGIAQMKVGRFPDAVESFQKALDIDPYYTVAWKNKGDALQAQEQYQAAIDSYDRALAINANDLYTLYEKGVCLQKMGRPDKAMEVYNEVVRLAEREMRRNPNEARYNAQLWTTKGDALSHLGRYQEALEAYQEAVRINPKMENAIAGMQRVNETLYRARSSPELLQTAVPPQTTAPRKTATPLASPVTILSLGIAAFALAATVSRRRDR